MIPESQRKWKSEHPDYHKDYGKRWRSIHPDYHKKYSKEYRKNKPNIAPEWVRKNLKRAWFCGYQKRKLMDEDYRLRQYLRNRIYSALKLRKTTKLESTTVLIGCSIEDLWVYLESRFEPGMTRQNYGKVWHVDHIIPCAIFDLTKPEHQKRCFHFSNLQPLFASDNLRKAAKTEAQWA